MQPVSPSFAARYPVLQSTWVNRYYTYSELPASLKLHPAVLQRLRSRSLTDFPLLSVAERWDYNPFASSTFYMASANIAGYELDEVSESEFEGLGDVLWMSSPNLLRNGHGLLPQPALQLTSL